jgi:histidyl-tRNA synthetase
MGISKKVKFRPELARGLEIYTGPIFEVFFLNSQVKSSIAAGGRYDKIIGNFLNKDKTVPALGFSFGIEPIIADMLIDAESYPNLIKKKTTVDILIVPIKIEYEDVIPIINKLRKKGLKCDIYMKKKKGLQGGLGLANFLGIPVTIIIGKKEIDSGKITIKNMVEEEQITVEMKKAPSAIKKMLKK